MRADIVSIFPAFFDVLELSLLGKARGTGLLETHVHDLREFTHDRHRTVDDSPYGGGAGMVMKPQPWGEALNHVAGLGEGAPHLLVPTPTGRVFTQAMARELADEPWLVFACGRYEGIDERVLDHAGTTMTVTPVSLGDYVLNGGEIATVTILEAVGRLIPGVVGNPASLVEESHAAGGLLEYPVYTRPAVWEGIAVPQPLLSGDHGAIAQWRYEKQLARTTALRPDLLELRPPVSADLGEIFTLQRACWAQEALANASLDIPALHETFEDADAWVQGWVGLVLRAAGRLIGGVRARLKEDVWQVSRLMVAPDQQGRGYGRHLLREIESLAPVHASRFELFTGRASADNIRMYRKAGYRPAIGEHPVGAILLSKPALGKAKPALGKAKPPPGKA